MEPRDVARLLNLGRMVVGATLTFAPRRSGAMWVGDDAERAGSQVLASALGVRDFGLGLGTVAALHRGESAATWLRMGALADAVDLAVTVAARDRLPPKAVAGVIAVATASTAIGLWLQSAVD